MNQTEVLNRTHKVDAALETQELNDLANHVDLYLSDVIPAAELLMKS